MSPFPGADRYLANNFGVYPIDSATNAGNVCHVSYSPRKIRSSICLSQVLTTEAMSPFDLLNESYYSRGAQVSRGEGGGYDIPVNSLRLVSQHLFYRLDDTEVFLTGLFGGMLQRLMRRHYGLEFKVGCHLAIYHSLMSWLSSQCCWSRTNKPKCDHSSNSEHMTGKIACNTSWLMMESTCSAEGLMIVKDIAINEPNVLKKQRGGGCKYMACT